MVMEPCSKHTEELLAPAALLNNFDYTGLQLFNGWDVLRENTHFA
jgi:hypothetical protein